MPAKPKGTPRPDIKIVYFKRAHRKAVLDQVWWETPSAWTLRDKFGAVRSYKKIEVTRVEQ